MKIDFLFQPVTIALKSFIHHAFRTVIGCVSPITVSVTYHLCNMHIYTLLGLVRTTLYTFPRFVCMEGT